eukprot:TRINITY_DN15504_c0_g1_i1.p1 TRINITY_DN15504_c0_g1~~TRINITY_DN15504_c0_g1_i1.p1  ORF type:complete len:313 (+),score=48.07 TRINITY_DN15504_c0_g1_i1:657-1595(+)
MKQAGAYLWSFNVSFNPWFMRPEFITRQNGLCNGYFWGCINRHSDDLDITTGDGHEDVERTCRYISKDGVVLRYRMFCAKTRCHTNKGGLQATMHKAERKDEEDASARKLAELFPNIIAVRPGSKLGLKFMSSGVSIMKRFASLTPPEFRALVATRQLHLLKGAWWGSAEKGRCFGGYVEQISGNIIVLQTWDSPGKSKPLVTEIETFNSRLQAGSLHLLRVSKAVCEAAGVKEKPWQKDVDLILFPKSHWTTAQKPTFEESKDVTAVEVMHQCSQVPMTNGTTIAANRKRRFEEAPASQRVVARRMGMVVS